MARSNQGHTMTLHTSNPNPCPQQASTSHTLRFPRYSPDKILLVKVTMVRSEVKSRSHNDVTHLQPLTNVPTKSADIKIWQRLSLQHKIPKPENFNNATVFMGSSWKPNSLSLWDTTFDQIWWKSMKGFWKLWARLKFLWWTDGQTDRTNEI